MTKWNDSSMIQHMYMQYKGIDDEEKLKNHITKLRLLTNNLDNNSKVCSAIKLYNYDYSITNIHLHKMLASNPVMYRLTFVDFLIDESTAILLVNDFCFAKFVITLLSLSSAFIDYVKDFDSLITKTDTKVYVSDGLIIEVNSDYLMINSKYKLTYENQSNIFKWMISQLQKGDVYANDIISPHSQFMEYLREVFDEIK